MKIAAQVLIALVACLHLWFLTLEMFLWQKPLGLKTFRMSKENAQTTAVLAANQGLYNGFLAVGLLVSLFFSDPTQAFSFRVYFLGCVIVAGVYGAMTVSRRILYVQAFPAAAAMILTVLASRG